MSCKKHSDIEVYGRAGQRGCMDCAEPMTSQQDTELRDTQDLELETILYAMAEDLKRGFVHSSVITTKQALTSWKDKEVERALMGEICPYHDVWDWRKHRAKLESLQSQGGKNEKTNS